MAHIWMGGGAVINGARLDGGGAWVIVKRQKKLEDSVGDGGKTKMEDDKKMEESVGDGGKTKMEDGVNDVISYWKKVMLTQ